MSNPSSDHAASGAPDRGYGKIDTRRARDITTDVGKSQGKENNPGDFGNEPAGGTPGAASGQAPAPPGEKPGSYAADQPADGGTRIKGRERGNEAALEAESGGGASELADESR
ncbi:MAG TPA: hypothetical protein VIX87_09915 [Steroidobacteraceae bacterium]